MGAASNVKIDVSNIQSKTGRVIGIASWYSTKWHFNTHNQIKVNDLFAGVDIYKNQFEYDSMPNHGPEACAMGIWDGSNVAVEISMVKGKDTYYDTQFEQYCINGHYGCWGDENDYTNVGSVPEMRPCEHKSNWKLQHSANFIVEYDGQDKIAIEADVNKYLTSEMNKHGHVGMVVGVASLLVFVLFACGTLCYQDKKDKYDQYDPIMKELRRTFAQYESNSYVSVVDSDSDY